MVKSLKINAQRDMSESRKEYLNNVAETVFAQSSKSYGISSFSKKCNVVKASPKLPLTKTQLSEGKYCEDY